MSFWWGPHISHSGKMVNFHFLFYNISTFYETSKKFLNVDLEQIFSSSFRKKYKIWIIFFWQTTYSFMNKKFKEHNIPKVQPCALHYSILHCQLILFKILFCVNFFKFNFSFYLINLFCQCTNFQIRQILGKFKNLVNERV